MVIFFSSPLLKTGKMNQHIGFGPMCLADMLFNSSPLGGTHQQQHFAEESPAQLSSFVHSGTELLDCCFRIHIFDFVKVYTYKFNIYSLHIIIYIYIYIYIYTEYIWKTYSYIDILLLIYIFAPLSSCHARETPTYISKGEHMFSCNFDESQF